MSKITQSLKKRSFLFSFILIGIIFPCTVVAEQTPDSPYKCRAKGLKVDLKAIVNDIEKYRRGETPGIDSRYELVSCLEAFSILKKYVLDPDPNVRALLTNFLSYNLLPKRLPLFIRQIELYPLKNNGIQYAYNYPCRQFRRIKPESFTNAVINRIESLTDNNFRLEIYLLGCVARRYLRARKLLEEMQQASFKHGLTDEARGSQLQNINYALAEAGYPDAEKVVLAEIENNIVNNETATLQLLSRNLRGFTNCRILTPVSRLILDERQVPANFLAETEKQLQVGDITVSVFTSVLRDTVGEERDINRRPHTIEERKRIYRQVQTKLKKLFSVRC